VGKRLVAILVARAGAARARAQLPGTHTHPRASPHTRTHACRCAPRHAAARTRIKGWRNEVFI
jgi:hypothetical protein